MLKAGRSRKTVLQWVSGVFNQDSSLGIHWGIIGSASHTE